MARKPDPYSLANLRKKSVLPQIEVLTPEARDIILEKLRSRSTIKEACEAAGTTSHSLWHWRKRHVKGDPGAARYADFFCELSAFLPPDVRGPTRTVKRSREWKRLRQAVSSLITCHLKRRGARKPLCVTSVLPQYLGYTADDLIAHLEQLFEPGMSWDNYGKWHVDHKIPASWFDFETVDDESFRRCWAISNLQPKWAMANTSKGNRFAE